MLIGVSKELRKLGLDCVEIKNTTDIDHYIDLARKENRYVLTRDSRYSIFSRELPPKQCLQIPSDSVDLQVLNILQYFQLQIDESSLHSRCIQCNSDNFLLANRFEMQLMRFSHTLRDGSDNAFPLYKGDGKIKNLKRVNDDIIASKTTSSGKKIQINRINPLVLNNQNYFFICDVKKS